MKPIALGMVAALAAALLTPALAIAQVRPLSGGSDSVGRGVAFGGGGIELGAQMRQADAPRAKVEPAAHKRGMEAAAALLSAAGAKCASPDGYYVGSQKDAKAKTTTEAYELACQDGPGLLIMKTTGSQEAAYQIVNCLVTEEPGPDGRPNTMRCRLPGNSNPAETLIPLLNKAGAACAPTKARMLGASASNAYFEVACEDKRAFIIAASNPYDANKDVSVSNCLGYEDGGSIACKLTPRATLLSVIDPLAEKADSACQVQDRRYILGNRNGDDYFEIACKDGKGFVVVADAKGAFKQKVECAAADYIAGGCSMTDVKTAKTDDNALYTRLARAGGYDCDVKGYRALAASAGTETVELECANRADGAVAIFPSGGARPRIYNCAAADLTGFHCNLTKPPAAYALLTAAVKKASPSSTCQVSDAKFLGANTDAGFVEVACSDKEPGYVVRYPKATDISDAALYCSQAKTDIGVACTLPTNVTN